MNQMEGGALSQILAEMTDLIKVAKLGVSVDPSEIDEAQRLWSTYADFESHLAARVVEGGSMYPMVFGSHKAGIAKGRLEEIRNLIACWRMLD